MSFLHLTLAFDTLIASQLYLEGLIDLNIGNLAIKAIKRQTLPDFMATHSEDYKEKIELKYNKRYCCLKDK